jgi:HEAT repeat protein
MNQEQFRKILSGLNGRTQTDAFAAAKSVLMDSDQRLERGLIRILKNGRRPFNRAAAAYAMQAIGRPQTISALERTLNNSRESVRVRGEAAEALAHRHLLTSHRVLLKHLQDSNNDIRFWCAFALGQMAEKKAIPVLEQYSATDKRIVKGFHSVAEEAADAVRNVRENKSHRRRGGCVFCVDRS